MKRGVIVAAAAITMAGAASAHLLTTSTHGTASHGTGPAAAPQEPPAPVHAERRASIVVHQAPVPLQVKPRPPVYVPEADTTEADAKGEAGSPAKASASASAASDDQAGGTAARAAIEADGYKGVQVLRKGEDGLWYAKALRGRTAVQLVVDSRGMVSTAD